MIKVFDASGVFQRQVGRPGEGPMEFRVPMPLFADQAGRVHVLDPGNGRRTIIGPDFELLAETRLPAFFWDAVPVNDSVLVLNMSQSSADGMGEPFHLVQGPSIVRSFGSPRAGIVDPARMRRIMATDRLGRVYAAVPDSYSIAIWTSEGSHVAALRGPAFSELHSGGVHEPPSAAINAIEVDDNDRLWVLIRIPRADWRDHMKEVSSGGRTILQPLNEDVASIFLTRIDVIDLQTRSIIGRVEREEYIDAFSGPRTVIEDRQTKDSTPQLVVWNISWSPSTER